MVLILEKVLSKVNTSAKVLHLSAIGSDMTSCMLEFGVINYKTSVTFWYFLPSCLGEYSELSAYGTMGGSARWVTLVHGP